MGAPFRITRSASGAAAAGADTAGAWMERLVKLVPAEILAVYLAGRPHAASIHGAWPLVCLALLLVVRVWGTRGRGKGPQWPAVGVAAVSFVIWVFALDGRILGVSMSPDLASLLVLVWTTLAPTLYRGD